jgi:hypothetical protein
MAKKSSKFIRKGAIFAAVAIATDDRNFGARPLFQLD